MSKHTPGPWWNSDLEVGTVPMMMVKVAKVSGATYEEALANARLIASAPELLKVLEKMVEIWEVGGVDPYPIKEARAAIAKAEGALK